MLHNYVFTFATVSETSMLETLQDGQWLAVSVLHYRIAEPQRGDIVTCHYPGQGEKLFVKRVVGLPGETLQIESGRVYIDGQALDEPYVVYPSEESLSIQLEEDQYFIMGDNRAVSLDSRSIGRCPATSSMATCSARCFPSTASAGFPKRPQSGQALTVFAPRPFTRENILTKKGRCDRWIFSAYTPARSARPLP